MLARWRADGAGVRPGVSPAEIAAFEAAHHIKLPADLSAYFQRANGMADGQMDQHLLYFWPLHELQPLVTDEWGPNNTPAFAGCYYFIDWSIRGWFYAINLIPADPRYGQTFISYEPESPVTDSFTAFMRLYNDDPRSLIR